MKHHQVLKMQGNLITLIAYCIEQKIDNFNLLYALRRNLNKVNSAVKDIQSGFNTDLLALEQKAYDLGVAEKLSFEESIGLLSTEDQEHHTKLLTEYNEAMNEENDLVLYLINPDKIEGVNIEYDKLILLEPLFPID